MIVLSDKSMKTINLFTILFNSWQNSPKWEHTFVEICHIGEAEFNFQQAAAASNACLFVYVGVDFSVDFDTVLEHYCYHFNHKTCTFKMVYNLPR